MTTLIQTLNKHEYKEIWTNVYGFSRSILAFGTLFTLIFHSSEMLFHPVTEPFQNHIAGIFIHKISLFYLMGKEYLVFAKWLSVAILILVISGYYPKVTGILHWWVAFSFNISSVLLDGGDQMSSILSFMLIPITLSDPRKNHWHKTDKKVNLNLNLVVLSFFVIIRLQVSIVYLQAGIAKAFVTEWADGTALYYWFTNPVFGAVDYIFWFIKPLLQNGLTLTFLTWSVMIFEVFLFLGLFIEKKWRPYLLVLGILFHFGIIVIHGLVSFFCSMTAALILYLRPVDESFDFSKLKLLVNKMTYPLKFKLSRLKWSN
jgi:antimicrobial peptide system SdpB family protein